MGIEYLQNILLKKIFFNIVLSRNLAEESFETFFYGLSYQRKQGRVLFLRH